MFKLKKIKIKNNVLIKFRGNKEDKEVMIPNGVTSIGKKSFYHNFFLKSVVLPDGVTSIGRKAFAECVRLTSVVVPNSLKTIGNSAFMLCCDLKSINIPYGVKTICSNAFNSCSSLASIYIPRNLTFLSNDAFRNCSSLINIKVDLNNQNYDSRDNCNAIIETKTNTLIVGCNNTIIPESVTTIGLAAFSNCSMLTSIAIPNSVNTFMPYAFAFNRSLSSIDMSKVDHVIRIYKYKSTNITKTIFKDCSPSLKIKVRKDLLELYLESEDWKMYTKNLVAES